MSRDLHERFWSKVQRGAPEQCWPWQSVRNNMGYGTFGMKCSDGKRRMVLAHRLAWQITHKIIAMSRDDCVCHRCDNPRCVNPGHLFVGNYYDNMSDMMQKGRQPSGERCSFAKLTEKQVKEIRARHVTGTTNKDLAKAFGVDASTISYIISRRNWKNVA